MKNQFINNINRYKISSKEEPRKLSATNYIRWINISSWIEAIGVTTILEKK